LFMAVQLKLGLIVLVLLMLGCPSPCLGQTPQQPPTPGPEHPRIDGDSELSSNQQLPGSIRGTVVDESGAVVAGVRVRLARENQSSGQEALSGDDGQFSFTNIAPGPFQLTIASEGFAPQASSGTLHSGEMYIVPRIALGAATVVTEVTVGLSRTEVAEEEIKDQEKQRVFGFIPNFYVTYVHNPVPLSSKQKFEIAWKATTDPVTLVVVGGIAGVQQAQNDFRGYGQGAQGFGKRYGASFADIVSGTFLGSAVLPSLLKQDPRYFYKGTGSKRSRILYAIASSVVCEGDNGHWQANYSNIIGNLAAGGISNLYYPAKDRNGAGLTFENGLIGIGASSAASLFQEFIAKIFTRNIANPFPAKP
jgi:Carboxypeptidase regulatory-like domain